MLCSTTARRHQDQAKAQSRSANKGLYTVELNRMAVVGSPRAPRQGPRVTLPAEPILEFLEIKDHWTVKEASASSYTVYRLVVRCDEANPVVWEVYRRYQEFRDLRRQLNGVDGCSVPALPWKRPFGVMDESFIKGREADLTLWMRDLVTAFRTKSGSIDPMRTQAMISFLTMRANQPPRIKEKGSEKSSGDWGMLNFAFSLILSPNSLSAVHKHTQRTASPPSIDAHIFCLPAFFENKADGNQR